MDGSLIEVDQPNKKLMLPMISRIKIMANMDISEKRASRWTNKTFYK